jgi:hypothetical protein
MSAYAGAILAQRPSAAAIFNPVRERRAAADRVRATAAVTGPARLPVRCLRPNITFL